MMLVAALRHHPASRARVQSGEWPSAAKPIPMRRRRLRAHRPDAASSSAAVSCRFSTGAPESSNCPPRLERDRATAIGAEQADDMVVIHDRLPAEPRPACPSRIWRMPPASRALIGHRREIAVGRMGISRARCRGGRRSAASRPARSSQSARLAGDRGRTGHVTSHGRSSTTIGRRGPADTGMARPGQARSATHRRPPGRG